MERTKTFERFANAAIILTPCLVAAAAAVFAFAFGCGRRDANRDDGSFAQSPASQNAVERPPVLPQLTARTLLREAISVYANAKYYSDAGYVEIDCELEPDRAPQTWRVPCSVTLAKPNYLRLKLGASRLLSDGKTMRAEIDDEAYANEALDRPAPLVVASIKELYPDPQFAESANLGVPSNLFWTSPQLALLFADDPRKTLVPDGAKLKLLEPEYLTFEEGGEKIPCDRLQIVAEDGERTLWFARKTRTLARMELPLEQTAAPTNDARVVALHAEFPNQTVSDAAPSDLSQFNFSDGADAKIQVERFLPPELASLKRVFPNDALRGAVDGAPIALGAGRFSLLYLHGCDGSADGFQAEQVFNQAAAYPFPHDQIRFLSVEYGPCEETDRQDGHGSSETNAAALDARFNAESFARCEQALGHIKTPSFLLLDRNCVVQRYIRAPFSFTDVQRILALALDGRDPSADEVSAYYEGALKFYRFLETADARDVYRATPDYAPQLSVPQRQFPATFGLREVWRYKALQAPSNPLALSDGINSTLAGAALVTPCDGSALAILSSSGKLIRKTTASAVLGEPISFVRSAEFGDGRRYFAASARDNAHAVCRFDGRFNDLGALDVGGARNRRVGDALLADANGDGKPELFLGLLGNSEPDGPQTHGLYAVDMDTRKILWKYETILAPRRLAVLDDGSQVRLLALDTVEGRVGTIAEFNPATGEQTRYYKAGEGGSIHDFATSTNVAEGAPKLVAIASDPTSGREILLGFADDGSELWRDPIPTFPDSAMERLVSGDVDGDGLDERIVASPDGAIQFFDAFGKQFDLFQYGSEITGVCVARWDGTPYLIVTDLNSVSAWKIERRIFRTREQTTRR